MDEGQRGYRVSAIATLALIQLTLASASTPPAPTTASIADPIDRKACELMLGLEPYDDYNGPATYLTRNLVTAEGDTLKVVDEGTAHDQQLEITDKNGKEIDPEGDDETQGGKGTRLLPFMGRVYVLSYAGGSPLYLDDMERLTADHHLIPVCRFNPKTEVSMSATAPADIALCDRVQKGRIALVPERVHAGRAKSQLVAGSADVEALAHVDWRNDGKPEALERIADDSGAGPGCNNSRFRPLGGKATPATKALLDHLQDKTSSKDYPPGTLVAGCADQPERWFTDHGKTYLEMRSNGNDAPVSEDSEYWIVSTVEKCKARRVCEANYVHEQPELASIWDGKAWAPPPPASAP